MSTPGLRQTGRRINTFQSLFVLVPGSPSLQKAHSCYGCNHPLKVKDPCRVTQHVMVRNSELLLQDREEMGIQRNSGARARTEQIAFGSRSMLQRDCRGLVRWFWAIHGVLLDLAHLWTGKIAFKMAVSESNEINLWLHFVNYRKSDGSFE